jgi:hypothetical protein
MYRSIKELPRACIYRSQPIALARAKFFIVPFYFVLKHVRYGMQVYQLLSPLVNSVVPWHTIGSHKNKLFLNDMFV